MATLKKDAIFVDVIHTNVENFGYKDPFGICDYYGSCPCEDDPNNCACDYDYEDYC